MDRNDRYDISGYTDEDLYYILGFSEETIPPRTEDLEDRIIRELKNYQTNRTATGKRMFEMLKNIYEHFFSTAADDENTGEDKDEDEEMESERLRELEENDFEEMLDSYEVDDYVSIDANTNEVQLNAPNLSKLQLMGLSQNELEAKIILEMQKYKFANTEHGRKTYHLFTEIYKRLFDTTTTAAQTNNAAKIDLSLNTNESPLLQSSINHDTKQLNLSTEEDKTKVLYSKTLDYTPGKVNPILKETFKRIISVDSQYREEIYPNATDFTLNFTEMLRDVVSMKLYAVQIPITWYTISNSYGSNFFYLKPVDNANTYGIYNNAAHEYKVEVAPGNYTPSTLRDEIVNKMGTLGTKYTDVNFGETSFSYGGTDARSKLTIEIQKVYNESYYDMDVLGTQIRNMLGLPSEGVISLTSIESTYDVIEGTYIVNNQNNTILIENYIPSTANGTSVDEILDTIKIEMPLHGVNAPASPQTLLNELNEQLKNNIYLKNSEVQWRANNTNTNTKTVWNIELNRYKTKNKINAKVRVKFPVDSNDPNQPTKRLWTGTPSAFGMASTVIVSESITTTTITDTNANNQYRRLDNEYIIFRPKLDVLGGVYIQDEQYRNNNNIVLQFDGSYNQTTLISAINGYFNENTLLKNSTIQTSGINNNIVTMNISITKVYTTADYRIVFYDVESFIKCTNASKSYRNATADTTLGYILGFKELTEYELSNQNLITVDGTNYYKNPDTGLSTGSIYSTVETTNSRKVELTSDSVLSIYLYNYFMIILDDFNQNHLNDGLVTIAPQDRSVTLPSYANRKNYRACDDPNTGEVVNSATATTGLTQKQIYSVEQIIAEQNKARNKMSAGPYVKDMFALLPVKASGAEPGSIYNEFGGTLQQQERVYFGPVNIRRISIKLINDKGDVVDLNGANWSFQLVCEQLYQNNYS
jgi:hypothetical protein